MNRRGLLGVFLAAAPVGAACLLTKKAEAASPAKSPEFIKGEVRTVFSHLEPDYGSYNPPSHTNTLSMSPSPHLHSLTRPGYWPARAATKQVIFDGGKWVDL